VLSFFFVYNVLQKGGEEIELTEAVDVMEITAPADVVNVLTPTDVGTVAIVAIPPAGVAAPPHTVAGGRAAEVASQALG
jgi:hypothetical protein